MLKSVLFSQKNHGAHACFRKVKNTQGKTVLKQIRWKILDRFGKIKYKAFLRKIQCWILFWEMNG